MRLCILSERNNTRSSLKNTSYYCYKAQLQFVGWLKQHLRRTGFRGQRCLPGGEGESCPGSWHLDKLLERSRCRGLFERSKKCSRSNRTIMLFLRAPKSESENEKKLIWTRDRHPALPRIFFWYFLLTFVFVLNWKWRRPGHRQRHCLSVEWSCPHFQRLALLYDKVSANTASSFPKCYKKSDGSQDARSRSPDIPN